MKASYLELTQQCSNELVLSFPEIDETAVDIITLEKSTGPELIAEVFTEPGDTLNEIPIPLGMDGLFNIVHLTIPPKTWYEKQLKDRYNNLAKFREIYVTDCNKILLLDEGEWIEIDPLVFTTNIDLKQTTIFKSQKFYFSTWYLQKCYLYLSQQVINDKYRNNVTPMGYNKLKLNKLDDTNKDIVYQRQFIWITLKVIQYLIEQCRLEQAQSIIEKVESCKGFCYSALNTSNEQTHFQCGRTQGTLYKTGCGCNH